MAKDIQSALERARMVAAKITGQLPDGPTKRGADSSDEGSAKKFASVNDAVGAQLAMFKAQQLGGNTTSEEHKVPDKLVGLVIGKGGDQLHRLQAETQCKVVISPDAHGLPDRVFTLIGTKENIERCKKSIEDILKRGANPGLNDPSAPSFLRGNLEVLEIKCPGNKCGLVIGKGGETIKRLGEQYGVKLVVVQDTSSATTGDKPIRITGEPDKVAKAKEAVMALINPQNTQNRYGTNEYGSKSGSGNEAYIKVPGDKAGIVIGKGGESIKEINRRSGAYVEIDKNQRNVTDGSDKMFVIKGTNEQIQYAQQLIYEKITGVQGSQPPSGFFNSNDQMSGGGSGNGNNNSNNGGYDTQSSLPGYGSPSQAWANPYQQAWQQPNDPKAASTDPNAAAWAAYYQQYYGQAAAATPAAAANSSVAATGGSTAASASSAAQPTINPQTGQPDYSQAWVEYYRSLGMYEQADAILRQTQQNQTNGSSSSAASTNGASSTSVSTGSGSSSSSTQQHQGQSSSTNGQQNGNTAQSAYGWPGYHGYQNYATSNS